MALALCRNKDHIGTGLGCIPERLSKLNRRGTPERSEGVQWGVRNYRSRICCSFCSITPSLIEMSMVPR
jgi:hypothetical protein